MEDRHLQGKTLALGSSRITKIVGHCSVRTESFFLPRGTIVNLSVSKSRRKSTATRPLDWNFHLKGKRPVAVLIVDRDRADLALAEMHVGVIGIAFAGRDSLIAEGFAQEFLQFLQFRFIHDMLRDH